MYKDARATVAFQSQDAGEEEAEQIALRRHAFGPRRIRAHDEHAVQPPTCHPDSVRELEPNRLAIAERERTC